MWVWVVRQGTDIATVTMAALAMMDNAVPTPVAAMVPLPEYFETMVDHFGGNGDGSARWNQAYYTNDTFWAPGSDAPVFLCVGGEGPPMDGSAVVSSVHCNIAVEFLKETGALMFAVEHRYYGCHNMSACPVRSFNNPRDDLKYLSSMQAVEDLATFQRQMSYKYRLSARNQWVTFGGSYPGMMASYARLKHPELFAASISSSSPVNIVVDNYGYYDVNAESYRIAVENVGGSDACHDAIRDGHKTIGTMMETDEGMRKLEKDFGLVTYELATLAGRRAFAGTGVAHFPGQDNDPSLTVPGANIKTVCQVMTDAALGDNVARLIHLRKVQQASGVTKKDRFGAAIHIVKDGRSFTLPNFWFYQTCSEYGFYQSCEVGSKCFFTQGLELVDDQIRGCQDYYGISKEDVEKNVERSLGMWGGLRPSDTKVMWVNGDVDPWSALAVLHTDLPEQPTLMVKGASHHAWTHPSKPDDQHSVIAARLKIRAQLRTWLSLPQPTN